MLVETPEITENSTTALVDSDYPGGGWRKIVLRGVLKGEGGGVGDRHSGGGMDLSWCDKVCHTQTFVDIDP
jgi:hypothetical protein